MTKLIIDPKTQKAIDEIEDLKRKILDVYLGVPNRMYLHKLPSIQNPSKWQRFKAWIKSKLKWINR